jgi:hypothetical protein
MRNKAILDGEPVALAERTAKRGKAMITRVFFPDETLVDLHRYGCARARARVCVCRSDDARAWFCISASERVKIIQKLSLLWQKGFHIMCATMLLRL